MTKKTKIEEEKTEKKIYNCFYNNILLVFFIKTSQNYSLRNVSGVVEAGNLSESISLISDKSPVNVAFKHEKDLMEAEEVQKAQLALEKEREEKKRQEANKDRKIAYLTFDDGPSTNVTPQILDILDEYDVKATFFL